jgi:hypothetical protein
MKYLCLAYEEEAKLTRLSRAEWDSLRTETLDYVETLRRNGRLILAEPVQSARTAVTVRVRDQHVATTDGPFTETKEQLGGLYVVDVASEEEALEIARRVPRSPGLVVQVLPVAL